LTGRSATKASACEGRFHGSTSVGATDGDDHPALYCDLRNPQTIPWVWPRGLAPGKVERMISELDIWRGPAAVWSEGRFFPLGALGLG
jgi:hypothetical protein